MWKKKYASLGLSELRELRQLREGWEVNAKRIYRLYTEEGLIVRTQKRRERAQRQRVAQGLATRPNQRWSMDFGAQRLPDGRWIRVLTVVDQYTRECLTLLADTALSAAELLLTKLRSRVLGEHFLDTHSVSADSLDERPADTRLKRYPDPHLVIEGCLDLI